MAATETRTDSLSKRVSRLEDSYNRLVTKMEIAESDARIKAMFDGMEDYIVRFENRLVLKLTIIVIFGLILMIAGIKLFT